MAAVVGFTDFLCGSLCQWLVLQTDIMEEEWSRERNYEKKHENQLHYAKRSMIFDISEEKLKTHCD